MPYFLVLSSSSFSFSSSSPCPRLPVSSFYSSSSLHLPVLLFESPMLAFLYLSSCLRHSLSFPTFCEYPSDCLLSVFLFLFLPPLPSSPSINPRELLLRVPTITSRGVFILPPLLQTSAAKLLARFRSYLSQFRLTPESGTLAVEWFYKSI